MAQDAICGFIDLITQTTIIQQSRLVLIDTVKYDSSLL